MHKILSQKENVPLLEEALKQTSQRATHMEQRRLHIEITDMWCPSCAIAISYLLEKQKGVLRSLVDYATDLALIEYDPMQTDRATICDFIRRIGYGVNEVLAKPKRSFALWFRFGFALFALLNLMMFVYPIYFARALEGYEKLLGWLSLLLATPLLTYCAFPFWRRIWLSLKTGRFGMETLILLGMSSAYLCSLFHLLRGTYTEIYFDSMAMVLVSVLLGKLMERRAKFSAKETLFRVTRSLPRRGRRNGEFVPIKEIEVGDTLVALNGEKIVLDGEVTEGEALVDESVMTGEARLVAKRKGSRLVGGSLIKKGNLTYRVTANIEESTLSKVLQFIERDFSKEGYFRPIDRIIPIFVPLVIFLGILSGHPMEVLLIACPCAIGIAVPLAEARLIRRFASLGVLIRNRNALFKLGKDPHFFFDKTGTLTEGIFSVISGLEMLCDEERTLLGRMASSSTHPICLALARGEPLAVEEIAGRGILYKNALLGSARFLREKGVVVPHKESEHSLVYFAFDGVCRAVIEVGDKMRALPPLTGTILSGDREEVVAKVAQALSLGWKSGLDPLEKRAVILQAAGTTVMVGDGINDAAALAAASVGISVTSGSDVSIQVADMVVSDLAALPTLVHLSKQGLRICRQNLFWAFFYNVVGIGFACFGLLSPLMAAAAMSLSSLSVLISSFRIDEKGGLKKLSSRHSFA